MDEKRIKSLFGQVKQQFNFPFELKPSQVDILVTICGGNNCLSVLPTGYGKSLTYILPSLLMNIVSSLCPLLSSLLGQSNFSICHERGDRWFIITNLLSIA